MREPQTRTKYSYDNASQLTGLSYSSSSTNLGNLNYSYDTDGRRMSVTGSLARTGLPLAVSSTAYNANNQLTSWGTANLFYDANGNMTSDGTHSFTWDARNRLAKIDNGSTASFTYDPFGRRASKNILGSNTNFLFDGVNSVQEVIGGTNTANSLTGGIDEVFQRTDSTGARNFLTDALGSTLALTDSAGAVQTSYTFEPFGTTTTSGASSTNSFAYTGRELDAGNLNLYFYRARYYNPQIGRFVSEDPIGFNGGANFYAYAGEDPINNSDPSGLCTDPGGQGTSYCIERYIPTPGAGFPFALWDGNNRGPNPFGGGYKAQQLIFQNAGHWTGYCQAGKSKIFGHLGVDGWLGENSIHGRKDHILASCSAGIGHSMGLSPDIKTNVDIGPDGTVSVTGTTYPSLDIWQYQSGQPPRLLFHYDATGGSPANLLLGSQPITGTQFVNGGFGGGGGGGIP
jgi:RHS repeat-associated protein